MGFDTSVDSADGVYCLDFRTYGDTTSAQYTFVVDGDILTLTGGNETTKGTYVLQKSE